MQSLTALGLVPLGFFIQMSMVLRKVGGELATESLLLQMTASSGHHLAVDDADPSGDVDDANGNLAEAPAGFELKFASGPCGPQYYLPQASGTRESLEACATGCKYTAECGFMSFCPSGGACPGGHSNKCALYSRCHELDSSPAHAGYTTYNVGWRGWGDKLAQAPQQCGTPDILPSGLVTHVEPLAIGIRAWENRSYTVVGSVPAEMSGALFFRLNSLYTGSLQFSGLDVGSVVFICSEDSDRGRDCGYHSSLTDDGFTRLPDGLERTGSRNSIFPMACYKKNVLAASFSMPAVTTPKCHQFVAVKCASAEGDYEDAGYSPGYCAGERGTDLNQLHGPDSVEGCSLAVRADGECSDVFYYGAVHKHCLCVLSGKTCDFRAYKTYPVLERIFRLKAE